MSKLSQYTDFLKRHKILVIIVSYIFFIGIIDKNSLWKRLKYDREISGLQDEIKEYHRQYERDLSLLDAIKSDQEAMEKVAREKYLMKKDNEDIFLFEEE